MRVRATLSYFIFDRGRTIVAQSVERLTAERAVARSITGTRPIIRFLKWLRNEDTSFTVQMAKPSRVSDNYAKWRSPMISSNKEK